MAGLTDFRKQHPEYNDLSDAALTDALYKKYYSDIPRPQYDTMMGTPGTTVSAAGPNGVPLPEGSVPQISQPQTTDYAGGFEKGFMKPIQNVASGAQWLLNKAGVDINPMFQTISGGRTVQQSAADMQTQEAQRKASGKIPSALTEMAGSIVSPPSLAAMALTKNPMASGAIQGALNTDATTPTGVATDAAIGAVTGKAGEIGAKAAGAVIAPQLSAPVNRLLARGVQLTPGQMVPGSALHRLEDAATSNIALPFVADAQQRSLQSANKAVVNDALAHTGLQLPDDVPAGHDSINLAQQGFDAAYQHAKNNLTLTQDPQFHHDLNALKVIANEMPAPYDKDFGDLVTKEVLNRFSTNGPGQWASPQMSGNTFKEVDENLGKEVQNFSGNGANGHDRRYADAVRELQAQVNDLASRSDPAYAARIQDLDTGYAKLARAEVAAAPNKDGIFSGAQLRRANVSQDNSVRNRASAGGNSFNQELGNDLDTVLGRTVPESGTVPRALVNGATIAALTGGGTLANHFGLNPLGVTAIAGALAPYTRVGGNVARTLMTQGLPASLVAPAGRAALSLYTRAGGQGASQIADAAAALPLVARRGIQASTPLIAAQAGGATVRHRDDNMVNINVAN